MDEFSRRQSYARSIGVFFCFDSIVVYACRNLFVRRTVTEAHGKYEPSQKEPKALTFCVCLLQELILVRASIILLFPLPSDNVQHDLQHGSLITFPKLSNNRLNIKTKLILPCVSDQRVVHTLYYIHTVL